MFDSHTLQRMALQLWSHSAIHPVWIPASTNSILSVYVIFLLNILFESNVIQLYDNCGLITVIELAIISRSIIIRVMQLKLIPLKFGTHLKFAFQMWPVQTRHRECHLLMTHIPLTCSVYFWSAQLRLTVSIFVPSCNWYQNTFFMHIVEYGQSMVNSSLSLNCAHNCCVRLSMRWVGATVHR